VRRDKKGMALLFDAMMFLTVMTIVSVSLLTLLRADDVRGSETQRYVEEVHKVILRSTLDIEDGAPITLAYATELCLRCEDAGLRTLIEEHMTRLLGYYFKDRSVEWLAELGPEHISIDEDGSSDHGSTDYVSEIRTDAGSVKIHYRLSVS
jgi:hypothetical protein